MNELNGSAWVALLHSVGKKLEKISQIKLIYTKVYSNRSWNVWNVVRRQKYGLTSAYVGVSRNGTYILQYIITVLTNIYNWRQLNIYKCKI